MTSDLHITEHEAAQVERANASSATPVVFVHGLWLLPSSWDRWVTLFEEAGYVALTPGWPDDPETVGEAGCFIQSSGEKVRRHGQDNAIRRARATDPISRPRRYYEDATGAVLSAYCAALNSPLMPNTPRRDQGQKIGWVFMFV